MNRTASDTIAAVIQVLIFFLEDSFIFFCVRILIHIIGNESGDKSNATYNWGPQKNRFAKRGPQSSRFTKRGVRKAKSLGTSALTNGVETSPYVTRKQFSNFGFRIISIHHTTLMLLRNPISESLHSRLHCFVVKCFPVCMQYSKMSFGFNLLAKISFLQKSLGV